MNDCYNCQWASESMVKGDVCGNRESDRYGKPLTEDGCEKWETNGWDEQMDFGSDNNEEYGVVDIS